jgi:hypothetical protein
VREVDRRRDAPPYLFTRDLPKTSPMERIGASGMRITGAAAGAPASVGRNDPCPCGSGRKFKHCCIAKSAQLVAAPGADSGAAERQAKLRATR